MNPPEFVIAILVIVFTFRIISHRMGMRTGWDRRWANQQLQAGDPRETDQLRDQVKQMQERIRVLERIVTDRGVETASQIEALRDRERIPVEDDSK